MSDTVSRRGYKAFTHDLRPPIRGGDPVGDGTPGCVLPTVRLDTSAAECGAGWNFCADVPTALRIAGLWPDGKPSRLWQVEAAADALRRGDKCRASSLTLLRECGDAEIERAIWEMSAWAGEHRDRMAESQVAWRRALARPLHDPAVVAMALYAALEARGLSWTVRQFPAARDARDAWAARDALTVEYAALKGWVRHDPDRLTVGLRDAYAHGAAVVLPSGPNELGFAMEATQ